MNLNQEDQKMKRITLSITESTDGKTRGLVFFNWSPITSDQEDLRTLAEYARAVYHREKGHRVLSSYDGKTETILEERKQ